MDKVLITVQQVVILVLEIGLGYYLGKKGKIPASALKIMTYLCLGVALPCAIILPVSALSNSLEVWRVISTGFLVILASTGLSIICCFFFFRGADAKTRPVYQMATVYGNSAFMGIPLVSAVLGKEAIIYATLMVIVETVAIFTHASLGMTGKKPSMKFILSKVFGLATICLFIGMFFCFSGIPIPSIVKTCMVNFAAMLTPLAMLIVGVQLAQQNLADIFKHKEYYLVAVIKVIFWPAVLIACLMPLRSVVAPVIATAIAICKGTPQAAVLGVLAEGNGLNGKAGAGVVGLTTLMSAFTLPIVAAVCGLVFK